MEKWKTPKSHSEINLPLAHFLQYLTMGQKYFWLWSVLLAVVLSTSNGSETQDETTAEEYLLQVNQTFSNYGNLEMEARWTYITDISEQNEVSMVNILISLGCQAAFKPLYWSVGKISCQARFIITCS